MGRLDEVDLTRKLDAATELERLATLQRRLLGLRLEVAGLTDSGRLGPPVCVLFEGWDASGKGGSIKRLVAPLDPRHVHVIQFAAPSPAEKRHHFLWRFSPALPGWGGMAVLDRSWYGRVLVERVEGLVSAAEVERAYGEIVGFEQLLVAEGMVLIKIWLEISADEQLKRFEARARDPLKSWKLTEDDWRNRARRKAYVEAIEQMLERTDRHDAPWNLVSAESKRYARVRVLEIVCDAIVQGLKDRGRRSPAA